MSISIRCTGFGKRFYSTSTLILEVHLHRTADYPLGRNTLKAGSRFSAKRLTRTSPVPKLKKPGGEREKWPKCFSINSIMFVRWVANLYCKGSDTRYRRLNIHVPPHFQPNPLPQPTFQKIVGAVVYSRFEFLLWPKVVSKRAYQAIFNFKNSVLKSENGLI